MLLTGFTPSKRIRKFNRRHAYHPRLGLPSRALLLLPPSRAQRQTLRKPRALRQLYRFALDSQFVDYTRQVYDEWKPWAGSADKELHRSYRIAKSSFLYASCVLANDNAHQEQLDDLLLLTVDRDGKPVVPERDRKRYDGKGRKKSVLLDTDREHRPEAEYRDQEEYCRGSTGYKPGRFADTTGLGFMDTSDPERALEGTHGDGPELL